jgi:uncharacterized protein (TIGR02271 family)
MATVEGEQIREGMTAWSADDEKLGKVIQCGETSFVIEKGLFFPKDYTFAYDEILDTRDDGVRLRISKAELGKRGHQGATAVEQRTESELPNERPQPEHQARQQQDEVTMPLVEEELTVETTTRQAGEVRVRKEVITEQRQIEVPVQREVVSVEHLPANDREATAGEARFQEEEVSIPLEEEEVEVKKRPVVREEVRVSKAPVEEQRVASAEVRKEVADIRGDADVDPTKR